jgi:hypothetical protein
LQEAAAVLPRRRLKPRTFRIPAGSSILIAGLARVDVLSAPSATIYVTIYVSDEIVTHLGKVEGAEERRQKHTGGLLVPPYERERLPQLELVPRTAVVEGSSWQEHSRDIAIAGESGLPKECCFLLLVCLPLLQARVHAQCDSVCCLVLEAASTAILMSVSTVVSYAPTHVRFASCSAHGSCAATLLLQCGFASTL